MSDVTLRKERKKKIVSIFHSPHNVRIQANVTNHTLEKEITLIRVTNSRNASIFSFFSNRAFHYFPFQEGPEDYLPFLVDALKKKEAKYPGPYLMVAHGEEGGQEPKMTLRKVLSSFKKKIRSHFFPLDQPIFIEK